MKNLFILFSLLASSLFLYGQEEVPAINNKKNTLGVGIYAGGATPLNLQFRYERQFANRWSGYSSADLGSTGQPRFQAGVFFDALMNKKRSALLRLGAGPVYLMRESIFWKYHNENIPDDYISELSVEFSLQFQYYLNPNHSLFTQVNNAHYLRESRHSDGGKFLISSIYLGYNYHF